MKRRTGEPAVYNDKRLNELPLPTITVDETSQSDVDGQSDADVSYDLSDLSIQCVDTNESSGTPVNSTHIVLIDDEEGHNEQSQMYDENQTSEIQTVTSSSSNNLIEFDNASNPSETVVDLGNTNHTQIEYTQTEEQQTSILNDFDPLAQENSTEQSRSDDHFSEDGLFDIACGGSQIDQAQLVVKLEPIISNEDALNELISEPEYTVEQVDDDIEIIVNNKIGFGKPQSATADALIKRQNDVISGTTPFDLLVSLFNLNI